MVQAAQLGLSGMGKLTTMMSAQPLLVKATAAPVTATAFYCQFCLMNWSHMLEGETTSHC